MKSKHLQIEEPVRANLPPKKPPYVPKVTKSVILVCSACSERYIKTRTNQNVCIKCFVKEADMKKLLPGSK